MLIKAAEGALVRHPHTRLPLPQVGDAGDPVEVDDSDLYWARLIRDGDVVRFKPAPKGRASSSKGE